MRTLPLSLVLGLGALAGCSESGALGQSSVSQACASSDAQCGLKGLDAPLGRDFRALTVSIDPRDTPTAAAEKQRSTIAALGYPEAKGAWPFLVGEEASIKALADRLGFRFAYDPSTSQYAHPAVVFALTPDGRISRYLYGTSFSPRDLRLALVEAGAGKTGSIVDRVLVTCYRYDPASRRYSPYILGFLRLGGALILAFVTGLLAVLWVGERRRRRALALYRFEQEDGKAGRKTQ